MKLASAVRNGLKAGVSKLGLVASVLVGNFFNVKFISDIFSSSDNVNKSVSKGFNESVSATDDFDGVATPQDDQELTFYKSLGNVGYTGDQSTLTVAKFTADVGEISDATVKTVSKSLAETVSVLEDFDYLNSKGKGDALAVIETTALALSRLTDDTSSISDITVKSLGKVYSDSATGSDGGSLIAQGYVDNNEYFADDYVGAKRTF